MTTLFILALTATARKLEHNLYGCACIEGKCMCVCVLRVSVCVCVCVRIYIYIYIYI